jgi:peptidoglycan/LPS O-acetylase OafA/YrhL
MLYGAVFLALFMVPVAALCWRIVVTKSRTQWIRVGAAMSAMISAVGALVVFDDLTTWDFKDWRGDVALVAACMASAYLLLWSQRRRSNRRHRTVSIIAAIIGLVPVAGTIISAVMLRD